MIVAEILLQRTRAEVVKEFLPRFVEKYPSWESLSLAEPHELQQFIRPLGLWRRRSRALVSLAEHMVSSQGSFPASRNKIEMLPGVGQYIANAVMLFSHGLARPLLDVNMARVLERVFGKRDLADIRYDPYLQGLSTAAVQCESPKALNWGIIDLAALVCLRGTPKCSECPVKDQCDFNRKH